MKGIISEVDRPIYWLLCAPELEKIYRRLGFVTVANTRLGLSMRRSVSGSVVGLDDLEKMALLDSC
jgi:hypothetical protein